MTSPTPAPPVPQAPPQPGAPAPVPVPQGAVVAAPQPAPSARRTADSATRVTRLSLAATVACLLAALLGFLGAQQQAGGMSRAADGADRVLAVMELRQALLEADGAATNAFLVGGLEPLDRRERYDEAIERASVLVVELSQDAGRDAQLIAGLNTDLATYTSLVEAARVNNRQGFPVGAAYLDQASTLVREQMLVDLDTVLEMAADDAAGAFRAGGWAALVLAAVVVGAVVLVLVQVRLAAMTRRRLNAGLVVATLLLVVAFVGGAMVSLRAAEHAADVRTDVYRPTLAVAQSAVLAAEARTLESFTLIKRGSGAPYEALFVERTTAAADLLDRERQPGQRLSTLLEDWLEGHAEIRALDDGGDWEEAVELAVTDDEGGPSAAYAAFAEAADVTVAEGAAQVRAEVGGAGSDARRAAWLTAAAGLLGAVVAWRGTAARREEYR